MAESDTLEKFIIWKYVLYYNGCSDKNVNGLVHVFTIFNYNFFDLHAILKAIMCTKRCCSHVKRQRAVTLKRHLRLTLVNE